MWIWLAWSVVGVGLAIYFVVLGWRFISENYQRPDPNLDDVWHDPH